LPLAPYESARLRLQAREHQVERNVAFRLIPERVKAGLRNARAKGKRLGRPRFKLDDARVATLRSQGRSMREIAAETGYSRGLVHKTLVKSMPLGVADAAD